MTCAACVGVVENALKAVHGVKHAAVAWDDDGDLVGLSQHLQP